MANPRLLWALALAVSQVACSGTVGPVGTENGQQGSTESGQQGSTESGQPGGTIGTPLEATGTQTPAEPPPGNPIPDEREAITAPGEDAPSAAYVRRLTHVEYDNTIEDLLGVLTNPSASFEADLAQDGFTNNAAAQNVSPTLAEQYVLAAESISEAATADLASLVGCDASAAAGDACVEQFISTFGRRAWRRPLSGEEQSRLLSVFTRARAEFDLKSAVQMVIQVVLLAPQFVYLLEPVRAGAAPGSVAPLDAFELATRLSYFLTGSTPDDALLSAAERGELDSVEGLKEQAERLLSLPRARDRIAQFYTEWLRLRNIDRMQKDTTMFPDYDLTVAPFLREQVQRFTQAIILDEGGTATDLLTASHSFVSPEIAQYYGVSLPDTPPGQFKRMDFDPAQRAGLLTHVAVMASLAHNNQTDPVHRGKFVRTGLLCEDIPPPPPGLVINVPEVQPGTSTRERFRQHQEDPSCRACHQYMDPIGLGFENYDALGQWRVEDGDLPIDASGEIVGTDVTGPFDGAVQLAHKLAGSEQAMECMARTWLRFALGRSDSDADAGAVASASQKFKDSGFVMKELLVAITETNTFRSKRVLDPNSSWLGQGKP